MPERRTNTRATPSSPTKSFSDILSELERSHATRGESLEGTVIAVSGDSIVVDIGLETEGVLPLAVFQAAGESVKPGDRIPVLVKGRDAEGCYQLSLHRVARQKDWPTLEEAFADKSTIDGLVTGVVQGGLIVDVGVRAFMPVSHSGARDAAEMEKLVGQDIRCCIMKLDVAEEDVVVDCRAVLEDQQRAAKERRLAEVKVGEMVEATVRLLTDFGAFVDIGGVDALLHVTDISWSPVSIPYDALTVGQQVEVKVLKVDAANRRVSVGMKQLQPDPWDLVGGKYKVGDRVRGTVTRLTDFGAFVELEKGIEGLIFLSQMSWSKVRKPSDVVMAGEQVEVAILGVNHAKRRISLGLKQVRDDPWSEVPKRFPVGSAVEGLVVSVVKFGAFVRLADGIEGMIHIGDMEAGRRVIHAREILTVGQVVRAHVLEADTERRRLRLGMTQPAPMYQLCSPPPTYQLCSPPPMYQLCSPSVSPILSITGHTEVEPAAAPREQKDHLFRVLGVRRLQQPKTALQQLATALGDRVWMLDLLAGEPFLLEGALAPSSIDDLAEFFLKHGGVDVDVSDAVPRSGAASELVLLGLYPSGAVRGIPGIVLRDSTAVTLHLYDVVCLLDPDSPVETIPAAGLGCSVVLAAFEALTDGR